jgi:transposase
VALRWLATPAAGLVEDVMLSLHPQARTTPAVRQEIARSSEPTGVLARRFSVSTETILKWRKRGVQDCQDHSSRPHKLPWKATDEERAIVCALRQATGFPLDDLTFIVTHFLPHLNRDAVYRILKAEGLGRLPPAQQRKRKIGTFKDYDLGFIHIDIKHLPKLETANGERRKRFLYVAIDRCSRWVHLAVKDDELTTSAVAFLKEALRAFPFKVTHVLTDRGSCFTGLEQDLLPNTMGWMAPAPDGAKMSPFKVDERERRHGRDYNSWPGPRQIGVSGPCR